MRCGSRERRAAGAAALLTIAACALPPRSRPVPAEKPGSEENGPFVRVALATSAPSSRLSATGAWRIDDASGHRVLLRSSGGETWTVESAGPGLRAVRTDGASIGAPAGGLIARPVERGTFLTWNGTRYRGEITVLATEGGLLVVNRLPLEEYLRGVVPLEIGDRSDAEREAVAAQAIAARSYAYLRIAESRAAPFDVVATVMHQVYRGADAERPVADAAVARTAGLVLKLANRIVNAPYHSTCGGSTAEAPEVWRTRGEPFLQRVSDRVPGTDRYYCDASPRFEWTRTFDRAELAMLLERYLRQYAAVPAGGIGAVRAVEVEERTSSGRVGSLVVATDRGRFRLRGNDVRFVLRAGGGEILNSTYFSPSAALDRDGRVARLTLRGGGYGHGVGMCQWGAIGRARAGHDYRAILRTYYPGTTVGPAH